MYAPCRQYARRFATVNNARMRRSDDPAEWTWRFTLRVHIIRPFSNGNKKNHRYIYIPVYIPCQYPNTRIQTSRFSRPWLVYFSRFDTTYIYIYIYVHVYSTTRIYYYRRRFLMVTGTSNLRVLFLFVYSSYLVRRRRRRRPHSTKRIRIIERSRRYDIIYR